MKKFYRAPSKMRTATRGAAKDNLAAEDRADESLSREPAQR